MSLHASSYHPIRNVSWQALRILFVPSHHRESAFLPLRASPLACSFLACLLQSISFSGAQEHASLRPEASMDVAHMGLLLSFSLGWTVDSVGCVGTCTIHALTVQPGLNERGAVLRQSWDSLARASGAGSRASWILIHGSQSLSAHVGMAWVWHTGTGLQCQDWD